MAGSEGKGGGGGDTRRRWRGRGQGLRVPFTQEVIYIHLPVGGCPGKENLCTNLRAHFARRHPQTANAILEVRYFPHPH